MVRVFKNICSYLEYFFVVGFLMVHLIMSYGKGRLRTHETEPQILFMSQVTVSIFFFRRITSGSLSVYYCSVHTAMSCKVQTFKLSQCL